MVHRFFEKVSHRPELLNNTVVRLKSSLKRDSKFLKFSKVFAIFFPEDGKFGRNMESWIDVISSEFEFDESKVNFLWKYRLEQLFRKLGFNPRNAKNIHVFHFFLYLIYMYRLLIRDNYKRDDKIFEFFHGFPIEETKVVMYTNRPSKTANSSGFAFHGVKSPCFRNMLPFLREEMRMLSDHLDIHELSLDARELETSRKTCDVKGWIEQGVLLLNMNLTASKSSKNQLEIQKGWQIFTDFLISHLNREHENLAFILMGSAVAKKKKLINSQRHMVMNFYHPSFYSHKEPPPEDPTCRYDLWERWLPFLNANFFLFQKCGRDFAPLIDWNNISGMKAGRALRLKCLRYFFKEICKASKIEMEMEPHQRVSKDLVVFRIHPGYLSLKAWEIHEEMYGAYLQKFDRKDFQRLHGHKKLKVNYY